MAGSSAHGALELCDAAEGDAGVAAAIATAAFVSDRPAETKPRRDLTEHHVEALQRRRAQAEAERAAAAATF